MNTQPNPQGKGRMNAYVCQTCGGVTVAIHEDDPPGVTPLMLRCRVSDECEGMAYSSFYPPEIPDPAPAPHVVWYRPVTKRAARAAIKATTSFKDRRAVFEHWSRGGSLMRELTDHGAA